MRRSKTKGIARTCGDGECGDSRINCYQTNVAAIGFCANLTIQIMAQRINSAVLSRAITKLYNTDERLTDEEMFNFVNHEIMQIVRLQDAAFQHQNGLLDDSEWERMIEQEMRVWSDIKLVRALWRRGVLGGGAGAAHLINAHVAKFTDD